MPRGKELTKEQIEEVYRLRAEGNSHLQIACAINKSKTVVTNLLKKRKRYRSKKRKGRKLKLTQREQRHIFRVMSNNNVSSSDIQREVSIPICRKTAYNYIKRNPNLKYMKLASKPPLKAEHKQARLEWCWEHMSWTEEWTHIIFSDEKKFNLDGPDGFHFY